MANNFFRGKRMDVQQTYRGKVTAVIVLTIILFALILGGLIKVIADEKKIRNTQQTVEESSRTDGQNTLVENENQSTGSSNAVAKATPTPVPVPKVAIDAGHGGDKNLGSVKGGLYEKNANLAIALYLQKILEDLGYEVFMIRTDDAAVENESRLVMATESGADIYVSIHQNSLDEDSDATRGCEVWYSDLRDDGSDILAQYVVDALAEETGTRNRGIKLSNELIVLKYNTMPACLVECGFMSSETERNNLFTPEYQQKIAQGIANGIVKYLPLEQ